MLDSEPGAFRDSVLLSSAGALVVAGKADDLSAGLALAREAVDSGAAAEKLARLVEVTNRNGSGPAE